MSTGLVYLAPTGVDTVAKVALGSTTIDGSGAEYVYLQGLAGVAVGTCVTYNPATFQAAIAVAATNGRVAFAAAPVLANQFGWFCVKGVCACVTAGATVIGAGVHIAGSAGAVDDAVVATDRIENAYFTTTTTPAGSVSIVYPQAIGL